MISFHPCILVQFYYDWVASAEDTAGPTSTTYFRVVRRQLSLSFFHFRSVASLVYRDGSSLFFAGSRAGAVADTPRQKHRQSY